MVEIVHHFLVGKYWVFFWTFFVKKSPVLARFPRQGDIVGFEVSTIEEDCSEHGVGSVAPVIGEEALVVSAGLETVITSEGCPPQHHRDVRMFGRS